MQDFERTTDSWLERLYGGRPKKLAFVDETFTSRDGGRHTFYAVTAFMINSGDVEEVRREFARLAGHRKWHTTERFQEQETEAIGAFADYIAHGPGSSALVVQMDLASTDVEDLEDARKKWLRWMIRILVEHHAVDAVLYERRRPFEQKIDAATVKPVREFYPKLVILDVGSDAEPLLWGPDIIAWTFQRRQIELEAWFNPFVTTTAIYREGQSQRVQLREMPDK